MIASSQRIRYLLVTVVVVGAFACGKSKPEKPKLEDLAKRPLKEQAEIAGARLQPCVDEWIVEQARELSVQLGSEDLGDAIEEAIEEDSKTKAKSKPKPGDGTGIILASAVDDDGLRAIVRSIVECWDKTPCAAFAKCGSKKQATLERERSMRESNEEQKRERAAEEAERASDQETVIEVRGRDE